jgi:ABC-type bacteriocin/lantibiotic exporter with double-glycine peptidase domain
MGVNNSATAVPDAVIIGLLDTVAILGGLAAVATTSPALLLVTLVLIVVQLFVNLWITRISAERTRAKVTAQAAAQGRLLETVRAVSRLKVSGAQSRAFKRWSIVQADLTRADLAVRRITVAQTIIISAWPVIGLITIVLVSGLTGASFGEFVTAQTALAIATTTLAATAISAAAIFNGRAILSKVEPVLAATPEGGSEGIAPGQISGEVTFNDIVFRYDPDSRPVLDGVTFSVKPGEQVAIVGPSGCGKTTLMRILLGLEDPESGVITIDGQDLSVLDRPSFRRQVGSVLQSSTLLPGPIRDNVDMGRGLTSKEIWRALEWACVADEVRTMGMGLDTPVVDGGGTVSGGQRQRILLARALARDPRMLILDEATSALDNVTQGSIVEHLENLRLTRILIAHRLSTIQGADRIVVIAGGRVAQQGTFDELASQPGHFADLVQRQVT